jgi:hypothetical protein
VYFYIVKVLGPYALGDSPLSTSRNAVSKSSRQKNQPSSTDRAAYIRDSLIEIRKFAEDEQLVFLRYLLSMALEEANVSVVTTTKHPAQ